MVERDFQRLAFLARDRTSLKNALLRTDPVGFGDRTPAENRALIGEIRRGLSDRPDLARLLDLHLIAQYRLHGFRLPSDWWEAVLAGIHGSDLPPPAAGPGAWRDVPVLITDGRAAHVRRFLVAAVPDGGPDPGAAWPPWAGEILSRSSAEAVQEAARACRTLLGRVPPPRFHLFPLAVPNGRVQFTGRSLGLPLALGFLAAATGGAVPADLAATGTVSAGGAVGRVGGLESKRRGAGAQGFRAILCPAAEGRFPEAGPVRLLPVPDLAAAWTAARLYAPENADRLAGFTRMLKDPRALVDNIEAVPPAWLAWARDQGEARAVVDAVLASPVLFGALTDRLEACARRSEAERAGAVSALVPESRFETERDEAPLSAFRWCAVNLSIANHRGRISAAGAWARRARIFLDAAGRADLGAAADFFNHDLVARHNRFRFDPEPPAELRRYLDLLEAQYALQRDFGCPTHPVLGRLYGSISQNYGFLGPAYLDHMRDYSARARTALGEGTVPEFAEEWLRHYNYLAYALLDAGDRDGAAAACFAYLGFGTWEAALAGADGFTPWQHALIARLLADLGGPAAVRYAAWCRDRGDGPAGEAHPWQLWCFNLGRLFWTLGDRTGAEGWFRRSLALCGAAPFGATVRAMALLPLSGLLSMGCLGRAEAAAWEVRVREAARRLNPDHFKTVLADPLAAVLERIWERPSGLFPFNYR